MNMTNEWRNLLKTPGPSRTATLMLLGTWILAAIWGWFLVEPTVLRDSQNARDLVNFTVEVFPWLSNIRNLGPSYEKGLFLHCVYFLGLAPVAVVCNLIIMARPRARELAVNASVSQKILEIFICFLFSILLIWIMYSEILKTHNGQIHRTGMSFVASPLFTPLIAPFFIVGFWCAISSGFFCVYCFFRTKS